MVSGPSAMCRYYINNIGPNMPTLPFFAENGMSTIDIDNIGSLKYPQMKGFQSIFTKSGIECPRWPDKCIDFVLRPKKSGWPGTQLINNVFETDCHLVPKVPVQADGYKPKTWFKFRAQFALLQLHTQPMWRISFSSAEKVLVKSFTRCQKKILILLKIILSGASRRINTELESVYGEDNYEPFEVSSFLLKYVMFWTMEEVDCIEWRYNNIARCIQLVLEQFRFFIKVKNIPHYFLGSEKNLLGPDIFESNDKDATYVQKKCDAMLLGIEKLLSPDYMVRCLFSAINDCDMVDYMWNSNAKSLILNDMYASFCNLAEILKDSEQSTKETLCQAMTLHHQRMLSAIQNEPRRYGYGKNEELESLLQKEIKFITSQPENMFKLDENEKRALIVKITKEHLKLRRKPKSRSVIAFLFNSLLLNLDEWEELPKVDKKCHPNLAEITNPNKECLALLNTSMDKHKMLRRTLSFSYGCKPSRINSDDSEPNIYANYGRNEWITLKRRTSLQ